MGNPEVSPLRHSLRQFARERRLQCTFRESEGGEKWQAVLTFRPDSPEPLHAEPVRRPDHADA